jgi:REP element-mobilizing transposase RayT
MLRELSAHLGCALHAYCLMTNHVHILLTPPSANACALMMHQLAGGYSTYFNRRYKRTGVLWQGRFCSCAVDSASYVLACYRYIELNPVRAALVEKAEDYRWSSYRATAGLEDPPDWMDIDSAWNAFAPDKLVAQTYYREFVLAKIGCEDRLWDNLVNALYLGTEAWTKTMRQMVELKPRSTDHPRVQRSVGRPKMHEVVAAVARAAGVGASSIRNTRGSSLRRLAAWIGWYEGWVTLRTIAASLRLRSEGHISNLIRRCDRELGADPALLGILDQSLAAVRV